jgi:type IV secretion system protein TrbL
MMKFFPARSARFVFLLIVWTVAVTTVGIAQTRPDPPSQILNIYRAQRTNWFTNVYPAANTLFALLALIDFFWSAAVMVLEKQDFHSWVSTLVRKMMTIGAFYALLIYGRFWIPAIVDSFETLGQNAASSGPLDPGDIFTRGLNLAGALIDGATSAGLFSNFGGSLALVFAAAMCLLAFCAVTIQFVVAIVESYILVAAGFIFLGFGGSRWSSPYVERYIGLAVSIGVKIMLLYLLIGSGLSLSTQWLVDAENISTSVSPATDAFSIMGASLIFTALCWQAPRLVGGVLGGSPSLSGGDVASTLAMITTGAAVLGSSVVAVGGWAAGAVRGAMSVAQAAGLGSRAAAAGEAAVASAAPSVILASGSGNGRDRTSSNGPTNQPPPPAPPSASKSSGDSAAGVSPPPKA